MSTSEAGSLTIKPRWYELLLCSAPLLLVLSAGLSLALGLGDRFPFDDLDFLAEGTAGPLVFLGLAVLFACFAALPFAREGVAQLSLALMGAALACALLLVWNRPSLAIGILLYAAGCAKLANRQVRRVVARGSEMSPPASATQDARLQFSRKVWITLIALLILNFAVAVRVLWTGSIGLTAPGPALNAFPGAFAALCVVGAFAMLIIPRFRNGYVLAVVYGMAAVVWFANHLPFGDIGVFTCSAAVFFYAQLVLIKKAQESGVALHARNEPVELEGGANQPGRTGVDA